MDGDSISRIPAVICKYIFRKNINILILLNNKLSLRISESVLLYSWTFDQVIMSLLFGISKRWLMKSTAYLTQNNGNYFYC